MPLPARSLFAFLLLPTACGAPSEPEDATQQPRACGPDVPAEVDVDPGCSVEAAAVVDDPQGVAEIVWNATVEDSQAQLHALVGQFTCGTSPVYRGRADVRSFSREAPALEGAVVATVLDVGEAFYGFGSDEQVPHLVVASEADVHMYLRQPQSMPGTTQSSFPDDSLDGDGLVAECSNCVPNLTQFHDAFEIDLRAESTYFDGAVEAAIELERVEPEEVTWSDIETLSAFRVGDWSEYVGEFESCEPLLVRTFEDTVFEYAPPFGEHSADTSCSYRARYTARWWVDRSNPARHGVGDLVISSASHCCGGVEGIGEDCREIEF